MTHPSAPELLANVDDQSRQIIVGTTVRLSGSGEKGRVIGSSTDANGRTMHRVKFAGRGAVYVPEVDLTIDELTEENVTGLLRNAAKKQANDINTPMIQELMESENISPEEIDQENTYDTTEMARVRTKDGREWDVYYNRDMAYVGAVEDLVERFDEDYVLAAIGDKVIMPLLDESYEGPIDDETQEGAARRKALTVSLEELAQKVVDAAGVGWIISGYDGEEIELPSGFFAYRQASRQVTAAYLYAKGMADGRSEFKKQGRETISGNVYYNWPPGRKDYPEGTAVAYEVTHRKDNIEVSVSIDGKSAASQTITKPGAETEAPVEPDVPPAEETGMETGASRKVMASKLYVDGVADGGKEFTKRAHNYVEGEVLYNWTGGREPEGVAVAYTVQHNGDTIDVSVQIDGQQVAQETITNPNRKGASRKRIAEDRPSETQGVPRGKSIRPSEGTKLSGGYPWRPYGERGKEQLTREKKAAMERRADDWAPTRAYIPGIGRITPSGVVNAGGDQWTYVWTDPSRFGDIWLVWGSGDYASAVDAVIEAGVLSSESDVDVTDWYFQVASEWDEWVESGKPEGEEPHYGDPDEQEELGFTDSGKVYDWTYIGGVGEVEDAIEWGNDEIAEAAREAGIPIGGQSEGLEADASLKREGVNYDRTVVPLKDSMYYNDFDETQIPEDEDDDWLVWQVGGGGDRVGMANSQAIEERLENIDGVHLHYTNALVQGSWERVVDAVAFRQDNEAALKEVNQMEASMADYPLLDEEAHSEMEYEGQMEAIKYAMPNWDSLADVDTDEVAEQVFSWLWDNDQESLGTYYAGEDYVDEEGLKKALIALGYKPDDDDDNGDEPVTGAKRTAEDICPVTGEPVEPQGLGRGDGDGSGPGKGPRSRKRRVKRRAAIPADLTGYLGDTKKNIDMLLADASIEGPPKEKLSEASRQLNDIARRYAAEGPAKKMDKDVYNQLMAIAKDLKECENERVRQAGGWVDKAVEMYVSQVKARQKVEAIDDQNRDRLRQKQDKLLSLVGDRFSDDMQITEEYAGSPTIGDLKKFIFPEWETVIDSVISQLKNARQRTADLITTIPDDLKQRMADALKAHIGDVEIETINDDPYGRGAYVEFDDGSEWYVYPSYENAELAAEEDVRTFIETEGIHMMNEDFWKGFVDEQSLTDEIMMDVDNWAWEEPESYLNEEPAGEDGDWTDEQRERAQAAARENVEYDPVGWLEEMGYEGETLTNFLSRNIDEDALVEQAVQIDGPAHFLAGYDHNEVELGDDMYAYRHN